MSLPNIVSIARFYYHGAMLDINNVLNQLGIRKDDKAEMIAKNHVMTIFNDILPRLYGKDKIDELLKKKSS